MLSAVHRRLPDNQTKKIPASSLLCKKDSSATLLFAGAPAAANQLTKAKPIVAPNIDVAPCTGARS
jgi:hypothetical protein